MKTTILAALVLLTGCKEVTQEVRNDKPTEPTPVVSVAPTIGTRLASVVDNKGKAVAYVISIDAGWGAYKVMAADGSFVADVNPETGEYFQRDIKFTDDNCIQDPTSVARGPIGLVFADRTGNRHYRVTGKRTIVAKSKLTSSGPELIPQTQSVAVNENVEVDVTSTDPASGVTVTRKVMKTVTHYVEEPVDTTVEGLALQEVTAPYDFTQIAPLQLGL